MLCDLRIGTVVSDGRLCRVALTLGSFCLLLLGGGSGVGCGATRAARTPGDTAPPVTLVPPSPQSAQPSVSRPAPPQATRPEPSASSSQAPRGPGQVVILDEPLPTQPASASPPEAISLVEVARAERERRQHVGPPIVRIDNKNLAEFARGQKLTEAAASPEDGAGEGGLASGEDTAQANLQAMEEYWRTRIRRARAQWADAVSEVRRLEAEIARLRREFYAADDPYDRDARIKPLWDRALEELRQVRVRAQQAPEEVARVLDEGRQAGAFPGWLREGLELEPEETSVRPPKPPGEPKDPTLVEEPPER